MAVTVLETLSEADLARWRTICATYDLVQQPPPKLSLSDEEVRRVYEDYYAMSGELLESYGVEGAEADEAKISPHTGHIYIGAEE